MSERRHDPGPDLPSAGNGAAASRGEAREGASATQRPPSRVGLGDLEIPGEADRDHLRRIQQERQGRLVKIAVLVGLIVLLIAFVIQNARPVGVRFLAWDFSLRLVWLIVVATLAGGVAGYLVGRPSKHLRLHQGGRSARRGSAS